MSDVLSDKSNTETAREPKRLVSKTKRRAAQTEEAYRVCRNALSDALAMRMMAFLCLYLSLCEQYDAKHDVFETATVLYRGSMVTKRFTAIEHFLREYPTASGYKDSAWYVPSSFYVSGSITTVRSVCLGWFSCRCDDDMRRLMQWCLERFRETYRVTYEAFPDPFKNNAVVSLWRECAKQCLKPRKNRRAITILG